MRLACLVSMVAMFASTGIATAGVGTGLGFLGAYTERDHFGHLGVSVRK